MDSASAFPCEDDGLWEKKHEQFRSFAKIPPSSMPWTQPLSGTPPTLQGVPNNVRYHDCINIAWAVALKREPDDRLPLYVNFSQCASRAPWSRHIRCLTTSSKVYDFSRDKVLTVEETLLLQGIPAPDLNLTMFNEGSLAHAVGEAMCCPCVGAIMLGFYLNRFAPWWEKDSD